MNAHASDQPPTEVTNAAPVTAEPVGAAGAAAPHWLDALDHVGLAIWEAHLPSRAVRFTPGFLELLGYAPEALEPRLEQWRALLHPQDVLRIDTLLTRLAAGQIAEVRCECRLRDARDQYRALLLMARAGLRGEDGRARRLIATLFDPGDREALESDLADNAARFRAVFEASRGGLALMDLTGRWLDANEAFCQLLGFTVEELRERSFQDITPDEDLARELELAQSVLDGRQDSYLIEKRLSRKDGEPAQVQLLNRLVREPDGTPKFFLTEVAAGDERNAAADRESAGQATIQAAAPTSEDQPTAAAAAPRLASESAVVHPFRARAGFLETLDAEVHLARRGNQHLALILVGLDGLVELSARHGQLAADAVLAEIDQRLRGCVRRSDQISRFGSDAFAVVLKQLQSPEQALRVVESLLAAAAKAVAWRGQALHVNASVGASLFPQDGEDPEQLLQLSSRARFLARETGGNGFRFADRGFDAVMSDRSAVFDVLRRALDDDAVGNGYRPVLGAEDASPGLLLVQPMLCNGHCEPVPISDMLGEAAPGDLLELVQRASTRRADLDHDAICERFGEALPMAFELGGLQLRPSNLERALAPIEELRLTSPARVTVVLDERDVARMDERVFSRLADLQRRGLGIAVQGFGLGISHFPRLTQLNPGWVLLAEAVARRNTDPGDLRALRALIRMARCLDARIAWPTGVSLPPIQHSRLDVDAVVVAGIWLPESGGSA
jgi:PAS domain S-box-containing protein/diguanylate cyclase (GGDEF)-like protein